MFSIRQFQGFINGLIKSVENRLVSELLLVGSTQDPDLPTIPMDSLVNNPQNSQSNWFFTYDVRNYRFGPSPTWLWDYIFDKPGLVNQFIDEKLTNSLHIHWKTTRLTRFFKNIGLFKKELLVLFYLLGGGPPRSPELGSIRYKNSENSGLRNLFLENHLFIYITKYHKGYNQSAKPKLIHRYLPKEVSWFLVYYFYLVQPFEEKILILFGK